MGDENFKLKKSIETAVKLGSRYVIIVGENEAKSGAFAVKRLDTGEQQIDDFGRRGDVQGQTSVAAALVHAGRILIE